MWYFSSQALHSCNKSLYSRAYHNSLHGKQRYDIMRVYVCMRVRACTCGCACVELMIRIHPSVHPSIHSCPVSVDDAVPLAACFSRAPGRYVSGYKVLGINCVVCLGYGTSHLQR